MGRERWFLHDRGGAPLVQSQQNLSFLQKQFLIQAQNHYGQDKSDLPPEVRRQM